MFVIKALNKRKMGVSACMLTVSAVCLFGITLSGKYYEVVSGWMCSRKVQPGGSHINYEV